jgi:hypothetical protein
MKISFVLCICVLALVIVCQGQSVKKTLLMDNWTLEVLSGAQQTEGLKGKKYNTSLPTTLHLDFMAHGLI